MSQMPSLKNIIKAYFYLHSEPLSLKRLEHLTGQVVEKIKSALELIITEYEEDEIFTIKETASGFQLVLRESYIPWANKLTELKPQRLSRALLETLALIAYRQPVTRSDIEEIRGVAVSTQTIKFLIEQQWIKVIGHRDVPGKPSLLATTKKFLDDFSLLSLKDLPQLDLSLGGQDVSDSDQNINASHTEDKES